MVAWIIQKRLKLTHTQSMCTLCVRSVFMPHVHFTFPESLKKNLERLVPFRERSLFVTRATEQALQMKHLKKILTSERHVGSYPEENPELIVKNIRKKSRRIKVLP